MSRSKQRRRETGRTGKKTGKSVFLCSVLQPPYISVPETQRLFYFGSIKN